MTRITKDMREQMVSKALAKAGIFERIGANYEREREWAEAVRIDALGGPEAAAALDALQAEFHALLQRVPESLKNCSEIICTRGSIYTNVAGLRYRAAWNGWKPAPHEHTITADNPLAQQFHDLQAEQRAATAERDRIEGTVRGALLGFTTVKKLLEAWPEAAELLPDDSPDKPKTTLPAVPVADLNAMLGLPSEVPTEK